MAPRWLPADMAVSSKFAAFNILDIAYPTFYEERWRGPPIPASILLPKSAKPGKHAVMVRWHGGCFITGHRMYPEWFGNWTLELALSKEAILISPDYRLMPEATGETLLFDVNGLFQWLLHPDSLASVLPDGITADLDHILVTGESAGGWLAMQSPWTAHSKDSVCAVILHYPMLDMRDRYYQEDTEKEMFTPRVPQLDRAILKDYIHRMKPGHFVTSATPPDRVPLVVSTLQQGAYKQFFGDVRDVYPLEVLKSAIKQTPPVWLIHGTGDTVVPVEGSYKFEALWKEKFPSERLLVHYDEGSDHGFDLAPGISLETHWVKKGLDFIAPYWPRCEPLVKREETQAQDIIDHIKTETTIETSDSGKKRRLDEAV